MISEMLDQLDKKSNENMENLEDNDSFIDNSRSHSSSQASFKPPKESSKLSKIKNKKDETITPKSVLD